MVQTRGQWNQWANRGFRNTQSETSQSSQNSNSYSFSQPCSQGSCQSMDTPNSDRNMYGPNDHCKRHRKPDGEPKTEEVTTYRRRIPK